MTGNPVLSWDSGHASRLPGQLPGLFFLTGLSKGREGLQRRRECLGSVRSQAMGDVGAPERVVGLLQAQPPC